MQRAATTAAERGEMLDSIGDGMGRSEDGEPGDRLLLPLHLLALPPITLTAQNLYQVQFALRYDVAVWCAQTLLGHFWLMQDHQLGSSAHVARAASAAPPTPAYTIVVVRLFIHFDHLTDCSIFRLRWL